MSMFLVDNVLKPLAVAVTAVMAFAMLRGWLK